LRRELGDSWAVAESYIYYGFLEYSEGRVELALERWDRALALTYAQENNLFMAYCLTGMSAAFMKLHDVHRAVKLAGFVTTLLETLDVRLSAAFQRLRDEVLAAGQAQLAEMEWAGTWEEGRSATFESAYLLAREIKV
jgi:hypothetical protein